MSGEEAGRLEEEMKVWYFVNYGNRSSCFDLDYVKELPESYYKQRTFVNKVSMFYNTLWLGVL